METKLKEVEVYVALDGKEFKTKEACSKHELKLSECKSVEEQQIKDIYETIKYLNDNITLVVNNKKIDIEKLAEKDKRLKINNIFPIKYICRPQPKSIDSEQYEHWKSSILILIFNATLRKFCDIEGIIGEDFYNDSSKPGNIRLYCSPMIIFKNERIIEDLYTSFSLNHLRKPNPRTKYLVDRWGKCYKLTDVKACAKKILKY